MRMASGWSASLGMRGHCLKAVSYCKQIVSRASSSRAPLSRRYREPFAGPSDVDQVVDYACVFCLRRALLRLVRKQMPLGLVVELLLEGMLLLQFVDPSDCRTLVDLVDKPLDIGQL